MVIQPLDPFPDPDSLEMLDPDPDSMNPVHNTEKRNTVLCKYLYQMIPIKIVF